MLEEEVLKERERETAFGERSANASMINRGQLGTLATYGGARKEGWEEKRENYHWRIYFATEKLLPLLCRRANTCFNRVDVRHSLVPNELLR